MAWFNRLHRAPTPATPVAPAKSLASQSPSDPEMRFLDLAGDMGVIQSASVAELLRRVEPLVAKLYHEIGWNDAEFDRLMRPVIERYAAYVHLLPASESHHHARFGGLLIHGLEVATEAARMCRESVRDLNRTFLRDIELRANRKRLWPAAAACGGLLHDLGKVLVDQIVSSADVMDTWNPYQCSLADWLAMTKARSYSVAWKAGRRHKRHEPFGLVLTWPLIGSDLLTLFNGHGRDLFESMLLGALEDDTDPLGLGPVIRDADMASVRGDRDGQRKRWKEGAVGGHPLVNRFLEGCHGLLRDGAWTANEVGSPLWVTEDGIFVVWNVAMAHVLGWLRENSTHGSIPNDLDSMAEFLIDAKIARVRLFSNGTVSNTWDIKLPAPTGFVGGVVSQALLIADPNVILAGRAIPAPVEVTVMPDPTAIEVVVEAPVDAPVESPHITPGPVSAPPPAATQTELPMPPPLDLVASSVPRRPPTPRIAAKEPGICAEDALAYLSGMGALGEALSGLLIAYANNPEAFSDLACYRERKLVLRWPTSLAGYASSATDVMQYLKNNPSLLAKTYRGAGIDPKRGSIVNQAIVKEGAPPWPAVIFNEEFSRYAVALGDPRPARDRQLRVDFSRWMQGSCERLNPLATPFEKLVAAYARHANRTPASVRDALEQEPSFLVDAEASPAERRIDMAMVSALVVDAAVPPTGAS